MKITNIIAGLIITVIGILIASIDYYIVSILYSGIAWISSTIHAPEAFVALLTLIGIVMYGGIILIIMLIVIIVAAYLILMGLIMIISD